MQSPTFRLFKQMPSFVDGFATTIDFDASVYEKFNADKHDTLADLNALVSDWSAVGDDMREALRQHDQGTSN